MPCQKSIVNPSLETHLTPAERANKVATDFRRSLIAGGNPDIVLLVTKAIEDFKEDIKQPPVCSEHPTYQGMRTPRNNCETCWRLYLFKKDSK